MGRERGTMRTSDLRALLPWTQQLGEISWVVMPRNRAIVVGILPLKFIKLWRMHSAPARRRRFKADVRVQHLVKHDVANEILRNEILIEEGMNAHEVVLRRIAPEAYRVPASPRRGHLAPRDGGVDCPVEVRLVYFVAEALQVVVFSLGDQAKGASAPGLNEVLMRLNESVQEAFALAAGASE